VVVVGGGFGGLQAALHLARLPVDVTLIDRRNFHLFQPLAYQVATGALSPAEIAYPLRRIFRRRANVRVLLAEVTDVDLDARLVRLREVAGERPLGAVPYDMLIVATGAQYNYFGNDRWRMPAPNLKTLEGVLAVRRRILEALEAAELDPDPLRRASWLTFVVVVAAPPGWRWPVRLPRSRTTCAPSSARSVLAKLRSCSSKLATGSCRSSRLHCRRGRSGHWQVSA
jgi:NADH dehydrogenase